ncbi:3-dehydroquinate synthase [Verrucomicrobiota bacterium]
MSTELKNMESDCYKQSFSVDYSYPVHFTRDLFSTENNILSETAKGLGCGSASRTLVYIDDGVIKAIPDLEEKIRTYCSANSDVFDLVKDPEEVPGGERTKNGWGVVRNIMASIGSGHLCRHSFVIAVGGGSVLDMVGFAASLVHRGVRLIRIPTTVLSQGDGGVGVKNGMDEHGMKNFVGTFAPPSAVLVDFDFLETLEEKYWAGGIAEALKVAIIKDADFFNYLESNAAKLAERDEGTIEYVVRKSAVLHLDHIKTGGDPFEFGAARPLDFGHWSAHKLEVLSGYKIGHGQAVAIGIALDSFYAADKGFITEEERDRILATLQNIGLPIWDRLLESKDKSGRLDIIGGLEEFREHLGGHLTITLPDHIGEKIEVHEMDLSVIEKGILFLKEYDGKA